MKTVDGMSHYKDQIAELKTKNKSQRKELKKLQDSFVENNKVVSIAIGEIAELKAENNRYKESLQMEQRDPNGTIWEVAERLQSQLTEVDELHKDILDIIAKIESKVDTTEEWVVSWTDEIKSLLGRGKYE